MKLGMKLESMGDSLEKVEETISAAALEYEGEIFSGMNHGQALDQLKETHPGFDVKKIHEGFITSSERFVDREVADRIAARAGQKKAEYTGRLESPDITQHR